MNMRPVAAAVLGLAMTSAVFATSNTSTAAMPDMTKTNQTTATSLNSDMDKLSYSIGVDLGKNFKNQSIEVNPSVMMKGLQDGLSGVPLQLTDDQMKDVLNKFQKDIMAKRNADFLKKAQENKDKGDSFLQENKAKPGVVSLPSGLQYKIIEKGNGVKPTKDDMVTVEYTGKLIDGQVFDSTEKAGKPATFNVSQVIPGWTEALLLMPAGSKWEIYVPATLAYGARGVGGPIGPNETLIFNVHLISVKKSDEKK